MLALVATALAWCVATLPPMRLASPEPRPAVVLLDSQGQAFARRGTASYPPVDARTLPPHVTDAFVAIEDRRFYRHPGIDVRGALRAALANVRAGGVVEGGSTITQQLVKNTMLGPEQTMTRKLREAVAAVWVDHRLGKAEVMSRYLSTAYFGDGAYGLAAASHLYFNKPPEALSVGEAAMLAGLVKAPSRLAPTRHLQAARARAADVVAAMVETGRLSPEQAASAVPATPVTQPGRSQTAAYYADWAYQQLAPGLTPAYGETEVRTSLDSDVQAAAERVIANWMSRPEGHGVGQVALVAMRHDGSVVAMVGGRDHGASAFNRATRARRQPGSTFKLFTYLAAFRAGAHPDSVVQDAPVKIGTWTPANADGQYRGPLTLEQAFARSSNVAAARVFQDVGAPAVVRAARDLGIMSPLSAVPSLALGTSEVGLLELTAAYAAVAAGAYPVRPSAIEARPGPPAEQRLDWITEQEPMLRLLQASASRGPAGQLPIATYGKTGTSQGGRDALFVGFAGDLVVGVWAGNDDGRAMPGQSGGRLPALIWRDVVEFALADQIAAAEAPWEDLASEWSDPEPIEPPRGWSDRLRDLMGV